MSELIDMKEFQHRESDSGEQQPSDHSNELAPEVQSELESIGNALFESSKEVLGNISSIGMTFNQQTQTNLFVVFPDELAGFESINTQSRSPRWKYLKNTQSLEYNGVTATKEQQTKCLSFIKAAVDALEKNTASFSKNITRKELSSI